MLNRTFVKVRATSCADANFAFLLLFFLKGRRKHHSTLSPIEWVRVPITLRLGKTTVCWRQYGVGASSVREAFPEAVWEMNPQCTCRPALAIFGPRRR